MFIALGLILSILILICLWVQKRYKFWNDRGFKSPPASFPFGNMAGMGSTIASCEGIDLLYKKYKGREKAVGLYFFLSPVLMPLDIDLLKNIYVKEFSSFHDRGIYFNKEDDPLSANLLALEGQEWKELRMKLSPVFTSGKMKMMFENVDSIGDKFVKAIEKDLEITKDLEMRQLLARFSTDVISSVAFGIESNCLEDPNSEFYKKGKRLFELTPLEMFKGFFSSFNPDLARKLHLTAHPKEATTFLYNVFKDIFKEREASNIKRNDFVQLLLTLRETVSLSIDEMAAESFIFFTGGYETSSSTLTFCLYELAVNPEIQTKLRNEIQDGLDENGGNLSYDLLFRYQYLDMVSKETLRKYPPIPLSLRRCNKEYRIPETDLVIPEGFSVLLPSYSIHHDAEYYPEPKKFDPERFSPENSKDRNPITFLAFGEGPRNCIGARFGMLQVKLGLVKLLTNFEFSLCEKTLVPLQLSPTAPLLAPLGGMWLQVNKLK